MARTNLSIDEANMQPEFAILIGHLWRRTMSFDKSFPLAEAMLAAARKAGETPFQRKTEDRIYRKLGYLLANGFAEIRVDKEKIAKAFPDFFSGYQRIIEGGDQEGRQILEFISGYNGVEIEVYPDEQEMYGHLKEDLFREMKRTDGTQIMISHGSTFAGLKDAILADKVGLREVLRERARHSEGKDDPMFVPACGNYSAAGPVPGEIYDYLIEESANNHAKSLNDALGLKTFCLEAPATFSHVIPNNKLPDAEDFTEFSRKLEEERNPLWVLRQSYKSGAVYRRIYSEANNKISAGIETLLVTFGSSMELDLKLNYTKHLRKLDPILGEAIRAANQEILLRFSKNGIPLVQALEQDPRISKAEFVAARKALFAFQFSYLGVKESDCAILAERHRNTKKGMGTVIVANHASKLSAVLLSIAAEKPIANRVVLLEHLLPHVAGALNHVPVLKKKYAAWKTESLR